MIRLIDPQADEKILDYGCGLGRLVWRLRGGKYLAQSYGFDINNFRERDNENIFRDSYHFPFDKIYFMHSFAHIHPDKLFPSVFRHGLNSGGKVIVLTPNKDWVESMMNPGYIPDETVIQHYNPEELRDIFTQNGYTIEQQGQYGTLNKLRVCERIFLVARKP